MKKVFTVFMLGSLLLIVASCGNSGSRSFVRIVQASPDAGAVDITINGSKVLSGVTYGTGSNYFTVAPGNNIKFQVSNTTIDTQISLVDKAYYTISVVGLATGPTPTVTIVQSVDDHGTPAAGRVKIRVLHADPNYPEVGGGPSAVDAYVSIPANNLNGTPATFPTVNFQTMTSVVNLPVPTDVSTTSGNLRLRVAPAGDGNPDGDSIAGWDSGSVLFASGQIRTFVLLNNPAGTPFPNQLLILKDLN
jgi:Domain of unknown function (DUF4397)